MNARRIETRFVFDRHAAADLSVAYTILVPQRQARTRRAGPEGRQQSHDDGSDLRPGLLGPPETGPDDRLTDRGATRPRRDQSA